MHPKRSVKVSRISHRNAQVGNVYVKFSDEEDAETAVQALNGRFYAGRVLKVEYSPVTDFREARCRQYDEGTCGRGHYCNFMHVKEPAKELRKHLEKVKHFLTVVFAPSY